MTVALRRTCTHTADLSVAELSVVRELVLDRRALQTMAANRIKGELALEDLLQGNRRFQQASGRLAGLEC